ncbi:MAG: outer membrane beta-barrel protein [Candidatus Didemnitutus sp.]|nr:outer membrane beta-barrel protein [Candidatus Didemnitutus sp.]
MSKFVLHHASVACAALIAASLSAAEIGRSRVVSTVGARLDYDSNIFVNNSEVHDWVYSMNGGVRVIHDVSELTTDVGVWANGQIFTDHSDQNSFDPGIDARLAYVPSDKTNIKVGTSWRRSSMANEALNTRAKSADFALNGQWEHLASEKFGARLTGDYTKSDYRTAGYSDLANYSVGVDAIYVYSPKLKALAGVTWGESWTSHRSFNRRNPGGDDTRYTVGFEGELAPKVTGELSVGVQKRSFATASFGDNSSLYLSTRLTWAAAQKTVWNLRASQGLNVTAADQSSKNFDSSLSLTQELAERLSLEGSVGYTRANYSSFGGAGARRDHGANARLRLNYALSESASIDASAGIRDNSSDLATSDYQQFNFGAGFTYRF